MLLLQLERDEALDPYAPRHRGQRVGVHRAPRQADGPRVTHSRHVQGLQRASLQGGGERFGVGVVVENEVGAQLELVRGVLLDDVVELGVHHERRLERTHPEHLGPRLRLGKLSLIEAHEVGELRDVAEHSDLLGIEPCSQRDLAGRGVGLHDEEFARAALERPAHQLRRERAGVGRQETSHPVTVGRHQRIREEPRRCEVNKVLPTRVGGRGHRETFGERGGQLPILRDHDNRRRSGVPSVGSGPHPPAGALMPAGLRRRRPHSPESQRHDAEDNRHCEEQRYPCVGPFPHPGPQAARLPAPTRGVRTTHEGQRFPSRAATFAVRCAMARCCCSSIAF